MPQSTQKHDLSGAQIIMTEHVDEYRTAAKRFVKDTDVVLEAGCAGGQTTSVIGRHAKEVLGVDKNVTPRILELQQKLTTCNCTFLPLDAFDIGALLKTGKQFNKIFIDLSGNREPLVVVSLLESYEKVFKPDMIIVKNYKLKGMALRTKVFSEMTGESGQPDQTENLASSLWPATSAAFAVGVTVGVLLPFVLRVGKRT